MPNKSNTMLRHFSARPTRMVNYLAENLVKSRRWTMAELAIEFGGEMTEERIRRHFAIDGADSYTIARLCEVIGLPTQPAQHFLNGEITDRLKRQVQARGWTYPVLIRKLYPKIDRARVPNYVDRIQKFFENRSRDAWAIALLCDLFGLPTLPPEWFLSPSDFENPKIQEQLEFRYE